MVGDFAGTVRLQACGGPRSTHSKACLNTRVRLTVLLDFEGERSRTRDWRKRGLENWIIVKATIEKMKRDTMFECSPLPQKGLHQCRSAKILSAIVNPGRNQTMIIEIDENYVQWVKRENSEFFKEKESNDRSY